MSTPMARDRTAAPVRVSRRFPRSVGGALLLLLGLLASPAQAQIALVGSEQTVGISSPESSLTIARPIAVVEGHVMLAQVATRLGSWMVITAPAGWQLVERRDNGTSLAQAIYYKVAGAAEPASYTWSFNFSDRAAGGIAAYSGVDASDPILVSGSATGSGTSIVAPSITTTVDGARLVGFYANANGNNTFTAPSGMSALFGGGAGAGPNGMTIGAADESQASAGATGTRTATLGPTSSAYVAHLLALNPGASYALDHIRIDHPGSAVTCEPATITLRACADAACTATYPDPVTVTLASSPIGTWSSNPVVFSGTTVVTLSVATPQTVTLAAGSVPAPNNATQCWAGAVATCALDFADTGFIFSPIPHQTAGTESATITLRAVTTADDGTACSAALSGEQAIELASECIDPVACAGVSPAISGVSIANNDAAAVLGYTPVTLTFDAAASASFTLNHADVGRLQLHARHTVDTGAVLVGASNSFVVRPAGFAIGAIERSADGFANPGAADPAGVIFIGAGQPFSATVTAITSAGVAAPNFGNETAPEGVRLVASLELPVGGANPALDNDTIDGAAFAAGSATVSNLAWHEVGIVRLAGSVADGDYLGAGAVLGAASDPVGRFVPDHFNVVVEDGCAASGVSYARQPFAVDVEARSAGDLLTMNYAAAFARETRLSEAGDETGFSGNVIVAAGFLLGAAREESVSYVDPAEPQLPRMLAIRATDADGVDSDGHDDSTDLRSGRLRLDNVVASGLQPVDMPLRVESWQDDGSGAFGWITDADDACTVLIDSDFSVSGPATIEAVTLVNGNGSVRLAPSADGNVDVTAQIGVLAPWLQFDWDGDGVRDDPGARVAFGLHEGRPRQIFRRERIGN